MKSKAIQGGPEKPKKLRSAVSNGTKLFLGPHNVSPNSTLGRRWVDLADDLTMQIGGDPTPAQVSLIRNAASLMLLTEMDQAAIAAGDVEFDEERYLRRVESLRKLLNTIGLARVARDITPAVKTIDAHARAVRCIGDAP